MKTSIFILFNILATILCHELFSEDFDAVVYKANYAENYTKELTSNKEIILRFTDTYSKNPTIIHTWGDEAFYDHPIFIVVRQQRDITSWEIPLPVHSKTSGVLKFTSTSRILCHNSLEIITEMPTEAVLNDGSLEGSIPPNQLTISMSTSSKIPSTVTVRAEEFKDFYIQEEKEYSVTVSPSEPKYFYYKFLKEDESTTVVLEVNSEDDTCLTVSIQEPKCPVADLSSSIRYGGKHQTVDMKGGIIIKKREYPKGFLVAFVAQGDNFDCAKENSAIPQPRAQIIQSLNRSSSLNFNVKQSISMKEYVTASMTTLGIVLIFYVVFCFTTWSFYRWCYKVKLQDEMEMTDRMGGMMDGTDPNFMRIGDEIDARLKSSHLTLSDLARKDPEVCDRKSYAYLWHVLSIAIFYGIPVVQLVVTYQRVVNLSGNQDICYYNFLCAHPLFGLSDFNHIYSNIGYVLMGMLFLIITFYKQNFVLNNVPYGIPRHYGIFYAMGLALIMEGVLSACYHICPNQSNFQFDTSFMYVMATLCIIKLYQNRHPDINATAYTTFVVLGFVIFAVMMGILNGNITLWIIFITLYIALCFYISVNIYFLSYVKRGFRGIMQEWNHDRDVKKFVEPKRKVHFCLLLGANVLNIIFVSLGILAFFNGTDFATFLLGLLMINAILYTTVYIIMKIVHHETMCYQAIIFGVLALITWIGGGHFFLNNSTAWTLTPAESRQWNTHCIVMDFYDFHDIWHLLSAPALFFTFMLLLCLDDDLVNTPHSEIVVF